MFEVVGKPKVPVKKVEVRCSGLNEKGQRCKKRLFDYVPSSTPRAGNDRLEIKCRCDTVNVIKISELATRS